MNRQNNKSTTMSSTAKTNVAQALTAPKLPANLHRRAMQSSTQINSKVQNSETTARNSPAISAQKTKAASSINMTTLSVKTRGNSAGALKQTGSSGRNPVARSTTMSSSRKLVNSQVISSTQNASAAVPTEVVVNTTTNCSDKPSSTKRSEFIAKAHVRFDEYLDLNEENMRRSCKRLMNHLYSNASFTAMANKSVTPHFEPASLNDHNQTDGQRDFQKREVEYANSSLFTAGQASLPVGECTFTDMGARSLPPTPPLPPRPIGGNKSYLRLQYERRQQRQSNTANGPRPPPQISEEPNILPFPSLQLGKRLVHSPSATTRRQQQDLVVQSHELSKRRFFEKLERRESMKNFNLASTMATELSSGGCNLDAATDKASVEKRDYPAATILTTATADCGGLDSPISSYLASQNGLPIPASQIGLSNGAVQPTDSENSASKQKTSIAPKEFPKSTSQQTIDSSGKCSSLRTGTEALKKLEERSDRLDESIYRLTQVHSTASSSSSSNHQDIVNLRELTESPTLSSESGKRLSAAKVAVSKDNQKILIKLATGQQKSARSNLVDLSPACEIRVSSYSPFEIKVPPADESCLCGMNIDGFSSGQLVVKQVEVPGHQSLSSFPETLHSSGLQPVAISVDAIEPTASVAALSTSCNKEQAFVESDAKQKPGSTKTQINNLSANQEKTNEIKTINCAAHPNLKISATPSPSASIQGHDEELIPAAYVDGQNDDASTISGAGENGRIEENKIKTIPATAKEVDGKTTDCGSGDGDGADLAFERSMPTAQQRSDREMATAEHKRTTSASVGDSNRDATTNDAQPSIAATASHECPETVPLVRQSGGSGLNEAGTDPTISSDAVKVAASERQSQKTKTAVLEQQVPACNSSADAPVLAITKSTIRDVPPEAAANLSEAVVSTKNNISVGSLPLENAQMVSNSTVCSASKVTPHGGTQASEETVGESLVHDVNGRGYANAKPKFNSSCADNGQPPDNNVNSPLSDIKDAWLASEKRCIETFESSTSTAHLSVEARREESAMINTGINAAALTDEDGGSSCSSGFGASASVSSSSSGRGLMSVNHDAQANCLDSGNRAGGLLTATNTTDSSTTPAISRLNNKQQQRQQEPRPTSLAIETRELGSHFGLPSMLYHCNYSNSFYESIRAPRSRIGMQSGIRSGCGKDLFKTESTNPSDNVDEHNYHSDYKQSVKPDQSYPTGPTFFVENHGYASMPVSNNNRLPQNHHFHPGSATAPSASSNPCGAGNGDSGQEELEQLNANSNLLVQEELQSDSNGTCCGRNDSIIDDARSTSRRQALAVTAKPPFKGSDGASMTAMYATVRAQSKSLIFTETRENNSPVGPATTRISRGITGPGNHNNISNLARAGSRGPNYSTSSIGTAASGASTGSGGFSALPPAKFSTGNNSSSTIVSPSEVKGRAGMEAAGTNGGQQKRSSLLKRFGSLVSRAFTGADAGAGAGCGAQSAIAANAKINELPVRAFSPEAHHCSLPMSTTAPAPVVSATSSTCQSSKKENLKNRQMIAATANGSTTQVEKKPAPAVAQEDHLRSPVSDEYSEKISEADLVILPTKNHVNQTRSSLQHQPQVEQRRRKRATALPAGHVSKVPTIARCHDERLSRGRLHSRRVKRTASAECISSIYTGGDSSSYLSYESDSSPFTCSSSWASSLQLNRPKNHRHRHHQHQHQRHRRHLKRADSLSEELESLMSRSVQRSPPLKKAQPQTREKSISATNPAHAKDEPPPSSHLPSQNNRIEIDCVSPRDPAERCHSTTGRPASSLFRMFNKGGSAVGSDGSNLYSKSTPNVISSSKRHETEPAESTNNSMQRRSPKQQHSNAAFWGFAGLMGSGHANGERRHNRSTATKSKCDKECPAETNGAAPGDKIYANTKNAILDTGKPRLPEVEHQSLTIEVESGRGDARSEQQDHPTKEHHSLNLYQNFLRGYVRAKKNYQRHNRHEHKHSGSNNNQIHHQHHHHHARRHHHHHHHHHHHRSSGRHCQSGQTRHTLSKHYVNEALDSLSTNNSSGASSEGSNSASVWGQLIEINHSDGTQVIELQRLTGKSWGFFVARGAINNVKGIFISRMHDKVAGQSLSGLLSIGDRILAIDENSVESDHDILRVNQLISKKSKVLLKVKPFRV